MIETIKRVLWLVGLHTAAEVAEAYEAGYIAADNAAEDREAAAFEAGLKRERERRAPQIEAQAAEVRRLKYVVMQLDPLGFWRKALA
jgi:hypothetical protein